MLRASERQRRAFPARRYALALGPAEQRSRARHDAKVRLEAHSRLLAAPRPAGRANPASGQGAYSDIARFDFRAPPPTISSASSPTTNELTPRPVLRRPGARNVAHATHLPRRSPTRHLRNPRLRRLRPGRAAPPHHASNINPRSVDCSRPQRVWPPPKPADLPSKQHTIKPHRPSSSLTPSPPACGRAGSGGGGRGPS